MNNLIPVSFATLPDPLFFAGKNFEKKISPNITRGLELFFDKKDRCLVVVFQGKMTMIQYWTSIEPANVKDLYEILEAPAQTAEAPLTHTPVTQDINRIKTAQVETPHSHVQGGPGRGRKRDA